MTNVTRCLSCESVSEKNEHFLDLSVDIEPNSSINHCLKGFSATGNIQKLRLEIVNIPFRNLERRP